jgi:predicted component of type VI protein secretion system
MLSFTQSIALAALIALLSGCATQETPEQRAQRIEPVLAAAGFRAHPADSPAKLQNLQAMTPLKVRSTIENGKLHYWFADPVYCACLYTGNKDAYEHYQRLRLQQKKAEQEKETEERAEDEEINLEPWGPPY